jgi:hypothetical protein
MDSSAFYNHTLIRSNNVLHMGKQTKRQGICNQLAYVVEKAHRAEILNLLCIPLFS